MESALHSVLRAPFADSGMNAFHELSYRENLHEYVSLSQAEYLGSPQYLLDIVMVRDSPRKRAQLCIALLKHFALDPLEDHTKNALLTNVLPAKDNSDVCWINLRLHQLVFFVGQFNLPKDSPEVQSLRQAIQDNLNGQLFKAAAMSRRLQPVYSRIKSRLDRRASTAGTAAYTAVYASFKKTGWEVHTAEERLRCDEARNAAYSAVVGKKFDVMDARMQFVQHATSSPEYQSKGFIGLLARFAVEHLRPVAQQHLAEPLDALLTA